MAQQLQADPVTLAMDYGDAEYEGYWIRVRTRCGAEYAGSAYRPKDGVLRLDQFDENGDKAAPLFIRTDAVVTAQAEP